MENSVGKYYVPAMMPLTARSFFVNIQKDEEGHPYGIIRHVFYKQDLSFYGLDDAIFKIDDMLDELGCVQAPTKMRSFKKKTKQDLNNLTVEERIQREKERNIHMQYRKIKELQEKAKNEKNTFVIHIMYRQYSSWQGNLLWREYSGNFKQENFYSVLELLKLIRSSFKR